MEIIERTVEQVDVPYGGVSEAVSSGRLELKRYKTVTAGTDAVSDAESPLHRRIIREGIAIDVTLEPVDAAAGGGEIDRVLLQLDDRLLGRQRQRRQALEMLRPR